VTFKSENNSIDIELSEVSRAIPGAILPRAAAGRVRLRRTGLYSRRLPNPLKIPRWREAVSAHAGDDPSRKIL
jgi:hypothetical protein